MQFYAKTTFERIEKFVEKSFGVRLFLKWRQVRLITLEVR